MENKNETKQCVLVTGASGGIGKCIAREFAEAGWRVGVHFNSGQEAARALHDTLPGDGHLLLQADIAQPEAVQAMVDEAAQSWGRLDALVNNAAVGRQHAVAEVSYEEWQQAWRSVLSVNLLAAANACYCAARQMMTQAEGGRIVNVGSRGGYRGEPRNTAYGASKAALHSLSQSLAQELAPHNIFVTAVAPGFVETGMAQARLAGPQGDSIRAQSPLGRVARPEEVARTVLFLASPGSEFLTGAVVDINGASYLR